MQAAIWGLAFQVHPYHWPVIGSVEDVSGLTTPDLNSWYHAHYQPGNATIVVVGDINADRTLELIKKYYGSIPGRGQPKREIAPEPPQNGERRLTLFDGGIASERFIQAYHSPSANEDDSYAMDILSNILFEGASSRAYRKLVDQMNIMEDVAGTDFTPTYPGLFMISGTMKNGVPSAQAEEALDQLIRDIQEHGVTAQEIQVAVRQLTVQTVDSIATPHGMAELLGTIVTVLNHPHSIEDDLEKYEHVTAADVQRVANKYLTPNTRSIVVLAPASEKRAENKTAAAAAAKREGGRR